MWFKNGSYHGIWSQHNTQKLNQKHVNQFAIVHWLNLKV